MLIDLNVMDVLKASCCANLYRLPMYSKVTKQFSNVNYPTELLMELLAWC